jgi:hypothetical protein
VAALEQARDAARALPKPAKVVVEDGCYRITGPLVLGPEDSGVTWEAAPGARPVISGGVPVTGWKRGADGVWTASWPEAGQGFEQLWVDGRRATRARMPDRGYFHLVGSVPPGVFPGLDRDVDWHAFEVAPEHHAILRSIPAEERAEVLLTVTHAWAVGQCRIEALDEAAAAVRIRGKATYPFVRFEPDQRWWVENFRAALDQPGEWHWDRRRGELAYWPRPGEDPARAEIIVPRADRFLELRGVTDVCFRGLSFRHGNYEYPADGLHDRQAATAVDGAIEIRDSRGIRFERCEVAHVGRHAIYFRNGCADGAVVHCHLHDLGAGGVRIGETERPEEERVNQRIRVDDCILDSGGHLHPSACGVALTHTRNCAVRHCDIGRFSYTGVSAGWNWGYGESLSRETWVENNRIHHLGRAYLSDMGGFYGLGTSPGTVVRGNHIHHVASHRYGGWGLYNDEGSTDVLMENNLVHDTSNAGFHQHYGYANRVRNNIFAFGRTAQVQRSRNESRLSFVYERNLVWWDPPALLLDGGESNWRLNDPPDRGEPKDTAVFRSNLYWRSDGKRPESLTKADLSWETWRRMGRDGGSQFADPKFVDPGKRDFRLRPDSPAPGMGFRPWDFTEAGVRREDAAWRELAARTHHDPTWEAEARPWPAPPYRVPRQTFDAVPVGGLGIRGARQDAWQPVRPGDPVPGFGVVEGVTSPWGADGAGSSRGRCLKAQDVPGLDPGYQPVLDIYPTWEDGTFRAGFDILGEKGADWFFEMRVRGGEFAAGPYVRWQGGNLVANNTASILLAALPPGEWCRVEITATTGAGRYAVKVTRQDGTVAEFPEIPCRPEWNAASYLLFSSLGSARAAYYIDNLVLEPVPATDGTE